MFRVYCVLVGLGSFIAAATLAWHYPLGWQVPIVLVVLWSVLSYLRPAANLFFVPMLLPLIGLYPWTGWLTFEEFDLLVLAVMAGGYARLALEKRSAFLVPRWVQVTILLMLVSVLVSAFRGFADAGGFVFGWFQGYDGPMNSVRVGKSFLWALALVPIMAWLDQRNSDGTARLLALGLAGGCLTAGLAALWERLGFTGLLDFSMDYRTTGLFWEMHVGGAALDGWILLTIPFVFWVVISAKGMVEKCLALLALAVVGYAALTTFSRGVYLGVLVSSCLLGWLLRARFRFSPIVRGDGWSGIKQIVALVLLGVLLGAAFFSAGYRGLVALLGIVVLGLVVPKLSGLFSRGRIFVGILLGLLAGLVFSVLGSFLPWGPYWIYTSLWVAAFLCLHPLVAKHLRKTAFLGLVALMALLVAAANVAGHWGGVEALPVYAIVSLGVLMPISWGIFSKRSPWPMDLHWQGQFFIQIVVLSSLLTLFVGGAYMSERFSTAGKDWSGRLSHWSNSIGLLANYDDMLFGKGLGRYPANYYFAEPNGIFPGVYRIKQEEQNLMLSLVGARRPMSFGDILRISQRLPFSVRGPFAVDLLVRAKTDVSIHAEVCEKHLLYSGACVVWEGLRKATNGRWERLTIQLPSNALPSSSWIPVFKTFSMGIGNESGRAEIDDVRLVTAGGNNVLENGDFSAELAHWFFSSDRDHMPWHAKNLWVNVFFDQGFLGLGAFILLTIVALWRGGLGISRNNELAPYWLTALLGFGVVGMFDSLTDVPRLAFMYYCVVLFMMIHRFEATGLQLSGPTPIVRQHEIEMCSSTAKADARCISVNYLAPEGNSRLREKMP